MAWLSNSVHPGYTHYIRPERYAEGDACKESVKEVARKTFFESLSEVDTLLQGKQWMMGGQYTVADPYALVFYGWGVRAGLAMNELKNYTAWKERMLARPAVRKILESEKNVLVQPA
jgi:glutathione S-transferase